MRWVLPLVLLTFLSSSTSAQSVVQGTGTDGSFPSLTAQFENNDSPGNAIWVASSGSEYGACSTNVPTDTERNTFVFLANIVGTGSLDQANQCAFAAYNIVGGTKDTITCYGAGTFGGISCNIVELSGVNAFDSATCVSNACVTDGNSSGLISSPAINTNFANEVLIGFATRSLGGDCPAAFAGPGPGYTQIDTGSVFFEYKIVSAPQAGVTTTVDRGPTACVWSLGVYAFFQAPTIALNPQVVAGGYPSVGTVALALPAPSGGASVVLSSTNTVVATVPASMLVPAGSTSATFVVNTSSVSSSTSIDISATYDSTTSVAPLAVDPVNPSIKYSIWNSSAAPAVPDDGGTSAVEVGVKFTADTSGFISGIRFYKSAANTGNHVGNLWTSTGQLLATATFTGESASGWQQVDFLSPIAVVPNTLYVASYHTNTGHTSHDPAYFTIIGVDNSPLHALASGSSGGNGVFATGTGSAFPNTTSVDSNYWTDVVFISSSVSARVQDLTLNPTEVRGGTTAVGTVTLNMPAPSGGTLVALSTGNPAVVTIPLKVMVAPGATGATFNVNTNPVAVSTLVSITASLGRTQSAMLTVNPPAIASVVLNPTIVTGGITNPTSTVTLNGAAPGGGLTVTLSTDNTAAVTVPPTVTVAAGKTVSPSFTVNTNAVTSPATVHVAATYNGGTQSATLMVNPAGAISVVSVALNPKNVKGGANSTGRVTLSAASGSGGLTVNLFSGNTAAATVPGNVTVPAGSSAATFNITTHRVTRDTDVTITATLNGSATAHLHVQETPPSCMRDASKREPCGPDTDEHAHVRGSEGRSDDKDYERGRKKGA